MDKKQVYGINLDDYSNPKAIRGKSGYLGTKEDFRAFVIALEAYDYSERTIQDAIEAIRAAITGADQEVLRKKHGPEFEPMHTLEIYRQFDVVTLERHSWQYISCNDAVYPMYADRVHMSMMIVMHGEVFYTAWRGAAEGLRVCLQGSGWTKIPGVVSGHPETVTYDAQDDLFEMRLFSLGERIDRADIATVISAWETREELGLHYLCRDIIAEGYPRMASAKNGWY